LAVLVQGLLAPSICAALSQARGDDSAWQDTCRAPTATKATEPKPARTEPEKAVPAPADRGIVHALSDR